MFKTFPDASMRQECTPKRTYLRHKVIHDYTGCNHLRGHIRNPGHPIRPAHATGKSWSDMVLRIIYERP